MKNVAAHIVIALILAGVLAVGAEQGTRVEQMQDASQFYKWIISAATQLRLQGTLEPEIQQTSAKEPMDAELFSAVAEAASPILSEVEPVPGLEGLTPAEQKLVTYANTPNAVESEDLEVVGEEEGDAELVMPSADEQLNHLAAVWDVAKSPSLAEERDRFFRYCRDRQLSTLGTQFDLNQMYQGDTLVSLSNLFMGFRTMAANMLWLQADKFWHQGMYYRMQPLMKTTVALDPHFIDAFLIGAWHLAYNATHDMQDTPEDQKSWDPKFGARVGPKETFYYEGIEFLKDGARKNPTSYKIYFDLGFSIYAEKLEDWENSVKYLTEAYRQPHDKWVPRMLYRSMMKNGQYEESLAGYEQYQRENPESSVDVVKRFIQYNKAFMAERDAKTAAETATDLQEQAKQAEEQGDQASALGLRQQAAQRQAESDQRWDDSIQVWQSIIDEGGKDPLAEGHILRMQALRLVDEGRYVEARALLDYARMQSNDLFDELSGLIIDVKLLEGSELNLSEKRDVIRRHLREALQDRRIAGKRFQFRDDGWYQTGFDEDRDTGDLIAVGPGSPEVETLKRQDPKLDDVLRLASMEAEYPDVVDTIPNLGDKVVFQAGDNRWYVYAD